MMPPLKMKLGPHIVVHERTLTLDSKTERREKKELSRRESRGECYWHTPLSRSQEDVVIDTWML